MNAGAVILAGGKAGRMGGLDKGTLFLGGESCIDRLLFQLRGFSEILLAVDSPERYAAYPYPKVVDSVPGQGPMQGLAEALAATRADVLVALAVDMPFFERGLADYVLSYFHPGCGAVAALDRTGRRHPLCAAYAKRAESTLRGLLASGERRLGKALEFLDARDAPLAHSMYPDTMLANVNTPEDLAAARALCGEIPAIAVCGIKNSGKTTLLRSVIPLLRQAGVSLGVIKHDGHDFVPDVPGTDSFLLREAGAERVAVYSSHRFLFTAEEKDLDAAALLPHFRGLDLVLVEGGKASALPKIEIVRKHQGGVPRAAPENLLAVCTDCGADTVPGTAGLPRFDLNDHGGVCRFILERLAAHGGQKGFHGGAHV